jgi:hypothetical protein
VNTPRTSQGQGRHRSRYSALAFRAILSTDTACGRSVRCVLATLIDSQRRSQNPLAPKRHPRVLGGRRNMQTADASALHGEGKTHCALACLRGTDPVAGYVSILPSVAGFIFYRRTQVSENAKKAVLLALPATSRGNGRPTTPFPLKETRISDALTKHENISC